MNLKHVGNFILHWVVPLLILGGAGLAVYTLGTKPKANRKKAPPLVAVPVDTIQAQPHRGPLTNSTTGLVVPFREVDLPTEISGRVLWKSDSFWARKLGRSHVVTPQELDQETDTTTK